MKNQFTTTTCEISVELSSVENVMERLSAALVAFGLEVVGQLFAVSPATTSRSRLPTNCRTFKTSWSD
jgi:hypothetical protein